MPGGGSPGRPGAGIKSSVALEALHARDLCILEVKATREGSSDFADLTPAIVGSCSKLGSNLASSLVDVSGYDSIFVDVEILKEFIPINNLKVFQTA